MWNGTSDGETRTLHVGQKRISMGLFLCFRFKCSEILEYLNLAVQTGHRTVPSFVVGSPICQEARAYLMFASGLLRTSYFDDLVGRVETWVVQFLFIPCSAMSLSSSICFSMVIFFR